MFASAWIFISARSEGKFFNSGAYWPWKTWGDSSFFITLYMLTWHGIHPTLSSPHRIAIVWQAATLRAHSLHWFSFWGPNPPCPGIVSLPPKNYVLFFRLEKIFGMPIRKDQLHSEKTSCILNYRILNINCKLQRKWLLLLDLILVSPLWKGR